MDDFLADLCYFYITDRQTDLHWYLLSYYYFYPNVYGLKLVKHSVFFIFAIECLHLSNATFIKAILHVQN